MVASLVLRTSFVPSFLLGAALTQIPVISMPPLLKRRRQNTLKKLIALEHSLLHTRTHTHTHAHKRLEQDAVPAATRTLVLVSLALLRLLVQSCFEA